MAWGSRRRARSRSPLDAADGLLEGSGDLAVELQGELVRRNAVAPELGGPGEAAKADFLQQWIEGEGLGPVIRVSGAAGGVERPNLLVRRPGAATDRCLWFLCHLDVVPPGDLDAWRSDPFRLRREGDKLVGRGVEDNHQGIVAVLLALRALIRAGLDLPRAVGLALVADEETGGPFGLDLVMKQHPIPFGPGDAFVLPDAGDEEGGVIGVAEKGVLGVRLRVLGHGASAAVPITGRNALAAGAHLAVALEVLAHRFPDRDALFLPSQCTFEPTRHLESPGDIHTVPGEDVFHLDVRVVPSVRLDDVLAAIREIATEVGRTRRVAIQVDPLVREDPAPATPSGHPLVRHLARAIRQVYGVEARPRGIGGGTLAARIRRGGWPAVVWARQDGTAHQPNEYCWLPNILGDARVLLRLMAEGDGDPEGSVPAGA